MSKSPLFKLCIALALTLVAPAFAERDGGSAVTIAERELARREAMLQHAREAMVEGNQAMKEKDYETAFAQYRLVLDILPNASETEDVREEALCKFCDAGVALAEQRIAEGRFGDAETIVRLVLEDRYSPGCEPALVLLSHLNDPDYFNKTVTPSFIGRVEAVKKLLLEADQFYRTGRYDIAMKRYDQVLNLDPYNIAARKGQERINEARSNYGIDARNEARSRLLWEVDKAWQSPVRRFGAVHGEAPSATPEETTGNEALMNKLSRIIIPQVQFRDATVREAIDFLKQKSVELDVSEPDPSKRGVNIVLKLEPTYAPSPAPGAPAEPAIPGLEAPAAPGATPAAAAVNPPEARISLSLRQIPMIEALNYIANLAGLKVKVDPYAVLIVPQSEPTDVMITKEYRVRPGFVPSKQGAGAAEAPASGGGAAGNIEGGGLSQRAAAREFLEGNGVQFPPGASANYLPSTSRLIVRNTQENIDLIDTLVAADLPIGAASQVEIESKFVEINQGNLKELSFDWLLGAANIPGGGRERVFFGGGTVGTTTGRAAADFPFATAAGPIGGNPVTSGIRSGNTAITANGIDSLLQTVQGATNIAPAIFGVAGIFTDPQFQVVIRALNQKKGIDLLSAPRVTTKSGQRAVIEIIRELKYPTAFTPPQIPQTVGNTNGVGGAGVAGPVTPTTPSGFETRNTGVSLEVEPVIGPDGYTIDLNLVPQVVEFEGFINYGSPITLSSNVLGITTTVTLTDNVINQPVFSTRKVTTSVSIWDGQTVSLGGLIREDVQMIDDKVPLLGDIPLVGRLFRSKVDQHLKKNLIIFVTARLINSSGEPVLKKEEEQEVIETLAPPEIAPPILPEAPLYGK